MTTPSTILLTGASDGIGLETAKRLATDGHTLILHGRNPAKLAAAADEVRTAGPSADISTVVADLSDLDQVRAMADAVRSRVDHLDVVINNAGVFETPHIETASGHDVRFIVNTIAPYLLTSLLLPLVDGGGRVVNLSSAAQAPVDLEAMVGAPRLSSFEAYAQSKLALTMWTAHLATTHPDGPVFIAVNPGSYLATKMVKEGFDMAGHDINIGVDILVRASLSEEFAGASGRYWDNDNGRFAPPHPAGQDSIANAALVAAIEGFLA